MRVAGLLLAAGAARRMGALKQVLPLAGRPLLQHSLDHLAASRVEDVILVLGCEADRVLAGLEFDPDRVRVVRNPDWEQGLSSSLRAGLDQAHGADAVLVALGDLPLVPPAVIDRVVEAARGAPATIAAPTWQGRRGHPVLFKREHFEELRGLQGDVGGAPVLRAHPDRLLQVPVDTDGILHDVDLPADLIRAAEGSA